MCRIIEVVMLPEILRHIIKIFLKYLPHRLHENGFAISVESRRVLGGVAGCGLRAVTRRRQRHLLCGGSGGNGPFLPSCGVWSTCIAGQCRGGVYPERFARTLASVALVASLACDRAMVQQLHHGGGAGDAGRLFSSEFRCG